jgi:hypothetical protein
MVRCFVTGAARHGVGHSISIGLIHYLIGLNQGGDVGCGIAGVYPVRKRALARFRGAAHWVRAGDEGHDALMIPTFRVVTTLLTLRVLFSTRSV